MILYLVADKLGTHATFFFFENLLFKLVALNFLNVDYKKYIFNI